MLGSALLLLTLVFILALRMVAPLYGSGYVTGVVLVAVALLLSVGAAVTLELVRSVTRPLEEITRAARHIARGDWNIEIGDAGEDEIGDLASALNGMSGTIEKSVRELAESKGRLETVVSNMSSGVLLFDRSGRVNLLNPAAQEILGVGEDEAMNRPYLEVVKNYSMSRLIDQVMTTWKPVKGEISLIYPRERILEAQGAPFFGVDGEPQGVVVVLHDISEIRRLERVRAEFVANVSHELKTPVTAVKGFAETLLNGALYNYRSAEEFVKIINEEADRLSRLIHDLLELSRLESKDFRLRVERLDISLEIKQIVDKLKPQFQKKELGLFLELPQEEVMVEVDRDQLEQVLLNLLDNSMKYTPAGGRVEVGMQMLADEVVVWVKDTGIGIPKDDQPRIFERFYRVDKARSRKMGGTGLGLSIVKHIIEAHHGRVWVESALGKGSQFYFVIPKKAEV